MKRIALLAVIGGSLLALPSSAAAQSGAVNCPAGVQVSPSYICVHVDGAGGEAVINPADCSYINGWESNPGTPGYAGICTGATTDPGCDGVDNGSGANEGGCFWIKPLPINQAPLQNPVTSLFICGNTSGEDPANSSRDGCSIP